MHTCAHTHIHTYTHTHTHTEAYLILTPWKQSPSAAPKPGDHHSHLPWNKGCEILPVITAPLSALPACLCREAALSSIAQSFIPLFFFPSPPKSHFYCSVLAILLLLTTTERDLAWVISEVNIMAHCEGQERQHVLFRRRGCPSEDNCRNHSADIKTGVCVCASGFLSSFGDKIRHPKSSGWCRAFAGMAAASRTWEPGISFTSFYGYGDERQYVADTTVAKLLSFPRTAKVLFGN